MSTEIQPELREIVVSGISVAIVRKCIKNLHLGVYPPHGRVRVAVPLAVSDNAVRLAVIGKLGWIKRQQAKFQAQPRQSKREMISRESHYFLGRRYLLNVVYRNDVPKVILRSKTKLELWVRPGSSAEQRECVLQAWYRQQLKTHIAKLVAQWAPILGVEVEGWGVKKMKTRWGSCNIVARRIWLNLELAKKPLACLEYIVVHEMVHLLERQHNTQFKAYMDRFLPQWQAARAELNEFPLGAETWAY